MALTSREIYWSAILADFRRSRLTHVEFCHLRRISLHSFRKWLYHLRPGLPPKVTRDRDDQIFYATMLALALPFLVVGVVLTVRRLRDAGWPLWLVLFFFAPMPINIVFFIVLCLTPSRARTAHGTLGDVIDGPEAAKSGSKETRPRFSYKRAILAILIPLPVAAAVVYFCTHILRDYGWSLFVGLPFVLPMLSVVIYGFGREVTQRECLWIAARSGCSWR